MAEVATSVLHNVGNVLNSVNVSATLLLDSTKKSKVSYLAKAVALLKDHAADLGAFLTGDPKGKQIARLSRPTFAEQLAQEQQRTCQRTRTRCARTSNTSRKSSPCSKVTPGSPASPKPSKPADLVEDALRMNAGALARHEVALVRDYADNPAPSRRKTQGPPDPRQPDPQRQIRLRRIRPPRQANHAQRRQAATSASASPSLTTALASPRRTSPAFSTTALPPARTATASASTAAPSPPRNSAAPSPPTAKAPAPAPPLPLISPHGPPPATKPPPPSESYSCAPALPIYKKARDLNTRRALNVP